MKIPSFSTVTAVTAADTVKSQQAVFVSAQNAAKPKTISTQDTEVVRTAMAEAFSAIRVTGPSSASKPQGVPGMDMGLLSSMVERSLKMQEIHNDPSIPPEVKKKLLKPLEEANKNALDITTAKAEQEKKEKIIKASNEDADAIREAGEEIAESADSAPASIDGVADIIQAAAGTVTQEPTPVTEASPVYSASPAPSSAPAAGENVDTYA